MLDVTSTERSDTSSDSRRLPTSTDGEKLHGATPCADVTDSSSYVVEDAMPDTLNGALDRPDTLSEPRRMHGETPGAYKSDNSSDVVEDARPDTLNGASIEVA
jgi:hypothetical protein